MNIPLNAPLRTTRLDLEPLEGRHATALFDGLAHPRLYDFIPDEPPELDALLRRYTFLERRSSSDGTKGWLNWALKRRDDGIYCGYVQATVDYATRSALLAYLIFVPCGGVGLGREAVAAMIAHLTAHGCADRFEAQIDRRNVRSIALVEALGFRQFQEVADADFFKGATSHEVHFELAAQAMRSAHPT